MNAVVEVATASTVADAPKVEVIALSHYLTEQVPAPVATSTLRVLSQGSHSISAVAPDYIFNGRTLAEA